jgi:group I intron endonuclease
LSSNRHGNSHLQRAYNKYGADNFIFEILEECDEIYLASQENYWCNLLNVHNRNYGYNIQPTHPNNIKKHSEETKLKIRTNTKGIKKSEETKLKMSLGMRGKSKSEKHRKNLSKSKIGSKMSIITKNALKLANTGRKQSKEEIEKRANRNKKPIIQMDLKNNFIKEWESISDATKTLKITHISCCCKGSRNFAGGYKWRYKNA